MNKPIIALLALPVLFSACPWIASAQSNYVRQATVYLGTPAYGISPLARIMDSPGGCATGFTLASGSAPTLCSADGGVTWQTPAPTNNNLYSTIPNSGWIYCLAQGEDSHARFQTTFELPADFTNASLSLLVFADNVATVSLNGVEFGAQTDMEIAENFQNPPAQFNTFGPFVAGTNILLIDNHNFGNPSGVDFLATVSCDFPPVAQWTIKDSSGKHSPAFTTEGHMVLTADGASRAIANVINTSQTLTFSIVGPDLGCIPANTSEGWTLTAGTNNGTVEVTAQATGGTGCLATNFFFDLGPCQFCKNNNSCDVQPTVGSLDIRMSLGPSRLAVGQAFLEVKSDVPDARIATPQFLHSDFTRPEIQNITGANGFLRQVAALDRIIDILTNSATSYSLSFYDPTNVVSQTNGLYQFSGSPFRTVTIALNGDTNHVRLTDSLDANTSDYTWLGTGWALSRGGGLQTEIKTITQVGAVSTTVRTIQNAQSVVQSTTTETWETFSFGNRLTKEVFGSSSNARTNTYAYNTNGLLDTVTRYDGSWDKYQYDSLGRQLSHFSPFTNAAPTTNSSLCRLTSSIYTNSVVSGSGDDWTIEPFTPRQVTDYVLGTEVSRRYTILQAGLRIEIQCVNPGAAWNNSSNLFTTNFLQNDFINFGQPARTVRPDQTMQLFAYDREPLPRTSGPWFKKTTTWTGAQSDYSTVVDGTRQETWIGQNGFTVLDIQTDIASGILLSSNFYSYDSRGHLTNTTYLDGTSTSQNWDCCRLLSTTDRDGTVTTNIYDALNRQVATVRTGITTSNILDAVGNVLGTVRYGTDGSAITMSQATYDDGGQQTISTDALGNNTYYTNYLDGSGQFIRQTTYPDSSTRIETYARDGSLFKVTGTAVHGVRYEYGVQSDGGVQRRYTKEIKLDASGSDTSEWTKTLTDGAERKYKVIFADSTSGSETDNPFNQSLFNTQGQLIQQRDPDGVLTLSQYNPRGEVAYTALDLNTNGVIDFAGSDRITYVTNDVLHDNDKGTNVRRTRTYGWSTSADASTLLATVETSTDGLESWSTTWNSSIGVLSSSSTVYAGSGYRYVTDTAPDGSYTTSIYLNGRLTSSTRTDSDGNQIGQTTYGYDAHGRQNIVADARTGTNTYYFNNADRISGMISPVPASGQSTEVTTNYFDVMGRIWKTTLPDGTSVTNKYDLTGMLTNTCGSRTYPVAYTYDPQGRMKTMTTWASYSTSAGAATTTWGYDAYRGWLTSKSYADGKGPLYGNTAAGRLTSRTWARGTNTTYSYNNAGDLAGIAYNDGATPSVSYGYDRRGRQTAITNGTAICSITLNDVGQVLSESYAGGPLNGISVTNGYDSLLRRTNVVTLLNNAVLTTVTNNFDAAGRLLSVSDRTNSATYTYLANSPLVSQIAFKQSGTTRMTTTKAYDNLNRLTSIGSSNASPALVDWHGYAHNPANQRIAITNTDGSFWLYGYDSLGQVASGKKYWSDGTPVAGQQFQYGFDDIGNRKTTWSGGDQWGANLRYALYSPNNLNQYSSRSVPGKVEVIGTATNTATVTVNNNPAYRKGNYYRVALPLTNSSAPVWQSVTNLAVLNNGTNSDIVTNINGNVFVPQTPENFTHDADGNLTQDGRWQYTWDGENRLVSMQAISAVPTAAKLKLDFVYDWQSRRVQKTVSTNNGSAYYAQSTNRFVNDGWNLLAELNGFNNSLLRSFVWGLDLSGSPQGAGGVGGLLALVDAFNGANFVAFDGNGNVSALTKVNDGAPSAQYEYGPFGELLRATGPMAKVNPCRFSTKYDDDETDFLYYGYRYYNPSTGGWISRDPLEEQGGLNLSGVGGNDAVDEYDSLGLCGCSVTSATLQSSRVIDDTVGFHWNVIGDVHFANRTGCVPIQWEKTTAWLNGKRITKAGSLGSFEMAPLDGTWRIDSVPYVDDIPPSGDLGHATGGVDVLVNSDSELRYHDPPGWHGLKRRDIYSLHINLKIVVYDANSNPPYRVVKESNILDLSQAGVWPNIGIVIPK